MLHLRSVRRGEGWVEIKKELVVVKKALIVTNLIGFINFLWNDIYILQEMGYAVTFAANGDVIKNEGNLELLQERNVRFVQLDLSSKKPLAKENLYAYREIKALLDRECFDLIHCHTPIAGFITRLAARKHRRNGSKIIYTTHGLAYTRFSTKKQWMVYYWSEKIASLFTDLIITINHEDEEKVKKLWCKTVKRINGVGVDTVRYHDVEIDAEEYKKQLGLPTDKIMVLSVGEISERKNHQIIVKALGSLPTKDDYIYVICGREVGDGNLTKNLIQLAKESGVDLYLLGHRTDIPQILHCSDIGAIPSVREGLGLAGIQSLCAEVPLVGTAIQGIREYIIDGVTGYLLEPFDIEGFAEAILKLTDRDHRRELQKNCYEVAKRFDTEISKKQMAEIFAAILKE